MEREILRNFDLFFAIDRSFSSHLVCPCPYSIFFLCVLLISFVGIYVRPRFALFDPLSDVSLITVKFEHLVDDGGIFS